MGRAGQEGVQITRWRMDGVSVGGRVDLRGQTFKIKNRPSPHENVSTVLVNRITRDYKGVRLYESCSAT